MANQIAMMQLREKAISEILEKLSSLSKGFAKPKLILIGGYALRAFIGFSRYTRDCDFAVREKCLGEIREWLREMSAEAFEQEKEHGYLRLLKLLKAGRKSIKLSLDFMQGQVVGRVEEDRVQIDSKFVKNSQQSTIEIAGKNHEVFVPSYTDYLILKIASARPSDIRDTAALVWRNGIPSDLKRRASEIVLSSEIFSGNVEVIVKTISDSRFVDSWRGTFLTRDFTEEDKGRVVREIKKLL